MERRKSGEKNQPRGLVDVHVQVPLVVQVAANSLTEHLHVTLISRHGQLLAVLEQLLAQIHVQSHSPVVRTLRQNRLLASIVKVAVGFTYQVFFSSIPALVESAYFFIAPRVSWSVLTSFM